VGLAPAPGAELVLIGDTHGHLGASLWLREVAGREEGPPPPVDLPAERRNGDFVRAAIAAGQIRACHDASDGGLLIAVAEMALGANHGITLVQPETSLPAHAFWFGEDQARYIAATSDAAALIQAAQAAGVPAARLGRVDGADLTLPDGTPISLRRLAEAHGRFFPAWMDA
jgi:phosphoribosylformylglycinamidine synthase